jgi:hypothetical protein
MSKNDNTKSILVAIGLSLTATYLLLYYAGKFFGILGLIGSIIYFIYNKFFIKNKIDNWGKNIDFLNKYNSKNSPLYINTSLILVPSLLLYLFGSFLNPNIDYCECQKLAKDAWLYTVGGEYSETEFNDWGDLEDCAEKIIDFMDYDMEAEKMNIEYIEEFSNQMCETGCYSPKSGSDRGKQWCLDD